MTIQDFIREGRKAALRHFEDSGIQDVEISETEVVKANDCRLYGVSVRFDDMMAGANVYMDDLFEEYQKGADFDELIEEFVSRCEYALDVPPPLLAQSEDMEFEDVKNRLTLKLLDVRNNLSYMNGKPYIDVGNGLALIAVINCERSITSEWAISVTNDLLDIMDVDKETLLTEAMKNTQELEPAELVSLTEFFMRTVQMGEKSTNLLEEEMTDEIRAGGGAFCLSNRSKCQGAAALFYPGVMDRISEVISSGYYVIPSSIHELIIVPDNSRVKAEDLAYLLDEGNRSVVEREDILSCNIFHYDKDKSQLRIAC
ncbi:MAG: hypothetical protein IJI11_01370 [Mogibacterium sp.]|nr:hypothetical protein [Mogibacterium sp.]